MSVYRIAIVGPGEKFLGHVGHPSRPPHEFHAKAQAAVVADLMNSGAAEGIEYRVDKVR